jgi:hypothetical protein
MSNLSHFEQVVDDFSFSVSVMTTLVLLILRARYDINLTLLLLQSLLLSLRPVLL